MVKHYVMAMAAALLLTATGGIAASASAATATTGDFGTRQDGGKVTAITLKNVHGLTARILTQGAMWQSMMVPDRKGHMADIILGYDALGDYEAHNFYSGDTVGRYANRIKLGKFSLDGKDYQLATNNPPNSLHGGPAGFWSKNWTVEHVEAGGKDKPASVTLKYISPDGEENYPGTMTVLVTYSLNDNNDLTISYKATTDKPTIVNLTNHALFNLAGVTSGRSALEASVKVEADTYLPTTENAIPTGVVKPVKGTPFDFTKPTVVNSVVRDARDPQILIGLGIDHNFNIRGGVTAKPKLAVTAVDAQSGRAMTISTTEPGIQFYTGNFLDGKIPGKGGQAMRMGDGMAFEAQHYPDSPNQPSFPSTRLDPGQTYTQVTVHHFYTIK
jgi:aldose 1-epimerase